MIPKKKKEMKIPDAASTNFLFFSIFIFIHESNSGSVKSESSSIKSLPNNPMIDFNINSYFITFVTATFERDQFKLSQLMESKKTKKSPIQFMLIAAFRR